MCATCFGLYRYWHAWGRAKYRLTYVPYMWRHFESYKQTIGKLNWCVLFSNYFCPRAYTRRPIWARISHPYWTAVSRHPQTAGVLRRLIASRITGWSIEWVQTRAKTETASTVTIGTTFFQRFHGYFVDSAAPNECSCIPDARVRIFAATPPITSPTLPSTSLQHIITSLPIIPCCSASLWLLRRLLNLL